MDSDPLWFEQFRLDVQGQLLWHGDERLSLSPKAFAILRYLVEHPGQLVTKASLLEAVWPNTIVGDGVLAVGIAELRKALQDDPRAPRFVETLHRRGYRFLPSVTITPLVSRSTFLVSSKEAEESNQDVTRAFDSRETRNQKRETRVVGRDAELGHLHSLFGKALQGERQIVFVSGEAGSGKTALVEAFLEGVRNWTLGSGSPPPQFPKPRAQSLRCGWRRGSV